MIVYRPWGNYKIIFESKDKKVKILEIFAGDSISLQKHNHRNEVWYVLEGKGLITIDGQSKVLDSNSPEILIPIGTLHRASAIVDLKILEIQSGTTLDELDIERFEDDYGRA